MKVVRSLSLYLSLATLINLWHHFCATCLFGVGEQRNACLLFFNSIFRYVWVLLLCECFYFVSAVQIDSIVPIASVDFIVSFRWGKYCGIIKIENASNDLKSYRQWYCFVETVANELRCWQNEALPSAKRNWNGIYCIQTIINICIFIFILSTSSTWILFSFSKPLLYEMIEMLEICFESFRNHHNGSHNVSCCDFSWWNAIFTVSIKNGYTSIHSAIYQYKTQ